MYDVTNAYPSINLNYLKTKIPGINNINLIIDLFDKFRVRIFGKKYKIRGLPLGFAISNKLFNFIHYNICI